MTDKTLNAFMLQEGLRQDALIHSVSSQLGTKNGLFMVFAAFVFSAESALAGMGTTVGLKLPYWAIGCALALSLTGIGVLLHCAFLERYTLPPILPDLRKQAETFYNFPDIKALSDDEKIERFQGKFVNSLADCIGKNFTVNAKIARNLERASWFIAGSVACLFSSLLWVLGKGAFTFFRFYCHQWFS